MRGATRITSRHVIEHTEPNVQLVGILEQWDWSGNAQSSHGSKVALILHGTLGHKNYLYQKQLASRLPMDSFRFDFRGNHESTGEWSIGKIENDLVQIPTVALRDGYIVALVIAHSRASISALRWINFSPTGRKVEWLVNISGRYRIEKQGGHLCFMKDDFFDEPYLGHYDLKANVAGRDLTLLAKREDIEGILKLDQSFVWDTFPSHTHVLTIHGLKDTLVPPYDALIYARALSNRAPGTHTLHLIEEADHNLRGFLKEVIETILAWLASAQRGRLKDGIWPAGVPVKL
ncbi:ectomycorrhiza-regulated esterase [Sistotremastrum niveocremeum HHB9708]|uniref:Ectomycorrhiza-regulated esterase n=1 Tax=Sistotremastrum niveocremeum HHB9708 TaxID=1314777 RepID=A0A164TAQ8_9AGAM|nr:ectomycorrhiza-regulated esterase [Sistotremastrum niveocremeum HHB9708]